MLHPIFGASSMKQLATSIQGEAPANNVTKVHAMCRIASNPSLENGCVLRDKILSSQ
jgi:hypothetical protein